MNHVEHFTYGSADELAQKLHDLFRAIDRDGGKVVQIIVIHINVFVIYFVPLEGSAGAQA